jgi:integrase
MFAQHRALEDPRTEVPPAGLLGRMYRRAQPHIYSPSEIAALVRAAGRLGRQMRPHTCVALFGLLASTGLRVGEALGLKREHVDLEAGLLTIVKSKSSKRRLVPLHSSATETLRRYAARRDRTHPYPRSDAFFLTDRGTALTYQRVTTTFRTLRRQLGWQASPGGAGGPCLVRGFHQTRHLPYPMLALGGRGRQGGGVGARSARARAAAAQPHVAVARSMAPRPTHREKSRARMPYKPRSRPDPYLEYPSFGAFYLCLLVCFGCRCDGPRVVRMCAWWVSRSSSAVVSFSSPKTWTHSPNARFVVTIVERVS